MTTTTATPAPDITDPRRVEYPSYHPLVPGQAPTGYVANARLMRPDLPRLPYSARLTVGGRGHYADVYLDTESLRDLAAEATALADAIDRTREREQGR